MRRLDSRPSQHIAQKQNGPLPGRQKLDRGDEGQLHGLARFVARFRTGLAVNEVAKGETDGLPWIVGAFVGAGLVGLACSYGQTYFTGWTGERMLADLRNHLFRHLQRLSLGFYERTRAGALISRITNDVEALDQLVTDGVTSLVQNSLTLIGTAVILFFLDWRLALATLTVVPLLAVGTAIFRRKSGRSYRRVRERLGLVTATLAEDIAGMRVLQAFTREEAARANFREMNQRYRDVNQETVIQNSFYFPYVDLLSSIATAIVLGFGAYLIFDGKDRKSTRLNSSHPVLSRMPSSA